ncbi:hypothetical protein MMC14_009122 [Varicellaria rhodocarpa]|nr:hypothetical protein [Varicellaria rhodocarpa]
MEQSLCALVHKPHVVNSFGFILQLGTIEPLRLNSTSHSYLPRDSSSQNHQYPAKDQPTGLIYHGFHPKVRAHPPGNMPQESPRRNTGPRLPRLGLLIARAPFTEPRLQELLFASLRNETNRLREKEAQWSRVLKDRPRLDTEIYEKQNTPIEPDGGRDDRNGHRMQRIFRRTWSCVSNADDNNHQYFGAHITLDTNWLGSRHLTYEEETPGSDQGGSYTFDPSNGCRNLLPLSRRISSQLLFYRLTVVFGMPPFRRLSLCTCWEFKLRHHDMASILLFRDENGAAEVSFIGNTASGDDALQLLNHLVGINCRHTFGGILAGAMS